jgi:hypothetical protein
MIGIEWEVATSITTIAGTLNLNTYPGLILDPNKCSAVKTLRAPKDPVPQGDGDIIHHRWTNGYVYNLVAQAMVDSETCAGGAQLRLIGEELGLHLQAMLNNAGRYCWQPTGYGDRRALDEARWFVEVGQTLISGGITEFSWSIDSPFPYVIDLTQQAITIVGSGPITNSGNTNFYPVIKVQGPVTTGFSVINDTLLQGIVYDVGRPGALPIPGGSYAEIDTYKGTIFMNGSGADLSAGIDPTLTNLEDPFVLAPGVNDLESNGANSIFLVNNAWA